MAETKATDAPSGASENGTPPAEVEPAPEPTQQIIRRQPKPLSLRDPGQLARAYAESGYWKDVTKAAQAVVKIAAGEELGLSPLASMQGITIIEGKIGYTGNLINQLIAQHPRYSIKTLERTNERCTLQFLIDGEPPAGEPEEGKVTFTVEDAERMELVKPRSNWVKTPRNMCFWRCLTEGARVHFPDLTLGTPVYSTEEIEEVIDVAPEPDEQSEQPILAHTPNRVEQLVDAVEVAEPQLDSEGVNWLDGLNVLLGSLGIDGFSPNESLSDELAKLTPEQGDALEAELRKLVAAAQQEGGEADAD